MHPWPWPPPLPSPFPPDPRQYPGPFLPPNVPPAPYPPFLNGVPPPPFMNMPAANHWRAHSGFTHMPSHFAAMHQIFAPPSLELSDNDDLREEGQRERSSAPSLQQLFNGAPSITEIEESDTEEYVPSRQRRTPESIATINAQHPKASAGVPFVKAAKKLNLASQDALVFYTQFYRGYEKEVAPLRSYADEGSLKAIWRQKVNPLRRRTSNGSPRTVWSGTTRVGTESYRKDYHSATGKTESIGRTEVDSEDSDRRSSKKMFESVTEKLLVSLLELARARIKHDEWLYIALSGQQSESKAVLRVDEMRRIVRKVGQAYSEVQELVQAARERPERMVPLIREIRLIESIIGATLQGRSGRITPEARNGSSAGRDYAADECVCPTEATEGEAQFD
ncbi:hypothetical protein P152DRAFT_445968 [Eremomyces bilateralis CBS 781.70]|uniref:Uncharacterized protein n=1 Tax=Eremomyces bilateralis CBS 781.70 TaxID=1392243 RepID=A0A6G1GEG8_9PEZI|nr:uncharacterized protein P152DRAFT_445968 [Eremomyces bilateralis CBS 781.70]KAF1816291.1 hypothetical protein P152DRAFT_445968 [Eremomyces bilateralis CBS 781.70]